VAGNVRTSLLSEGTRRLAAAEPCHRSAGLGPCHTATRACAGATQNACRWHGDLDLGFEPHFAIALLLTVARDHLSRCVSAEDDEGSCWAQAAGGAWAEVPGNTDDIGVKMTSATTEPSGGTGGQHAEGHGYGVVLFASVLLVMVGCFNLIYGIAAIANSPSGGPGRRHRGSPRSPSACAITGGSGTRCTPSARSSWPRSAAASRCGWWACPGWTVRRWRWT